MDNFGLEIESLLGAGILIGLATGIGIGAGIMFSEVIAVTAVVTGGISIIVGGAALGVYSIAQASWDRKDIIDIVH